MVRHNTPFKIEWIDDEREPKNPANPHYPDGVDLDVRSDRQAPWCKVDLPYPAKRCGMYVVTCSTCGLTAAATTAGRTDDPRSITMTCKKH